MKLSEGEVNVLLDGTKLTVQNDDDILKMK